MKDEEVEYHTFAVVAEVNFKGEPSEHLYKVVHYNTDDACSIVMRIACKEFTCRPDNLRIKKVYAES